MIMKKFIPALAVLFLVAACETAPTDQSGASGTGNGSVANGGINSGNGVSGNIVPGSQADLAANVGDRVFFALDSSVVGDEGQSTLEKQAAWLKQYSNVSITVEGHCDERGTREYNIALGERRAAAVKRFLIGQGIAASRIQTITYGKERPAVEGSDESAWSQNRRGVTMVNEGATN